MLYVLTAVVAVLAAVAWRGYFSHSPFERSLAAFLATIILGAGLFLLPIEVGRVGLMPYGFGLLTIWFLSRYMYRRVAGLIGLGFGGDDALASAAVSTGAGERARLVSLFGVAAYVIPAVIGYSMLGALSVRVIASNLDEADLTAAALVGAAAYLAATRSNRGTVLQARLASLLGVWSAGACVVSAMFSSVRSTGAAVCSMLVFAAGVVVSARSGTGSRDAAVPTIGAQLEPRHQTSVTALKIQLGLMGLLVVVGLVAARSVTWPQLVNPAASFGDYVTAGSVLLFAAVGTGLANTGVYPAMRRAETRVRVVDASMLIVLVVPGFWVLASSMLLDTRRLSEIEQADLNTAIGLAATSPIDAPPGWATLGALLGAIATLIAVTGAAAGFSESLGVEARSWLVHRRPLTQAPPASVIARGVLIGGLCSAAAIAVTGATSVQRTVGLGGVVGGTIIMFVLPLLAEHHPERRVRSATIAVAVVVAMAAATLHSAAVIHVALVLTLAPLLALIVVVMVAIRRDLVRQQNQAHQSDDAAAA